MLTEAEVKAIKANGYTLLGRTKQTELLVELAETCQATMARVVELEQYNADVEFHVMQSRQLATEFEEKNNKLLVERDLLHAHIRELAFDRNALEEALAKIPCLHELANAIEEIQVSIAYGGKTPRCGECTTCLAATAVAKRKEQGDGDSE